MANLVLIRDLCEAQKMTIRELGRRIGRAESSIQSIIRSGSTTTATLELIARELRVSPGFFFDGGDNQEDIRNLRKENDHLRALLAEKERTIEILISDRKAKN